MKTRKSNGKAVAPLIWVILFIIWIAGQSAAVWWGLTTEHTSTLLKIVIIIIPLALIAAILAVYIERVRELKRGQEDDLDKY